MTAPFERSGTRQWADRVSSDLTIRLICQITNSRIGPIVVTIQGTAEAKSLEAPTRLYINNIPEHDWLIALEFGHVDEGQPPERWIGVTEHFGFLVEESGRMLGFKALGVSKLDLGAPEYEAIWRGPRFCAPTLALENASAAEVIIAARAFYAERPSLNRYFFAGAIDAETKADEIGEWLACVESGDCMAHYGLGIALMDSGDHKRAYKHLRYYATIAPCEAWAQYWYARAAVAVNLPLEARAAVGRAIALAADEDLRVAALELQSEMRAD